MPIYEYQAIKPEASCDHCCNGFEALQQIKEKPILKCPRCGQSVKKIISWCHSAVMDTSQEHTGVVNKIKDYENAGMWSHAAELADKQSEKVKDKNLKTRALDNYKKAGYDADSLSRHAKLKDE